MEENKKYWLAINKIPKLGPVTIKKLLDHFGSIEKIWAAERGALAEVEGISRPAVESFLAQRDKVEIEKELAIISAQEIKVVTLADDAYPEQLKNIYDPPPVLFVKGEAAALSNKALGIVGTRKATSYGLEMAEKFAAELASLGLTIVSGLASGIDTAAHRGALKANGQTIAVLAEGVDIIYPMANKALAAEITGAGALVSEFNPGSEPEKGHFPRRNRIISGLSLGVIVVEGACDSGAMITAKAALDQGREVFAVPGHAASEQTKGPHWLIKQGAKLMETVDDVLEELNLNITPKRVERLADQEQKDYSALSAEEKIVLGVLSAEPKYLDLISAEIKLPVPRVAGLLAMLEIKRFVRQRPGKMFLLY